jgi:tetratricopeptide (TPR) repeat protein
MMSKQSLIQNNKPRNFAIFVNLICLIFWGEFFTNIGNLKAEPDPASPDTASTYNNLANLYLLESKLDSTNLDTAISYYHEAIKRDTSDGGIKLNLAIAYLVIGDTIAADCYFTSGLANCDSNLAKAYYLLTIELDSGEETRGMPGDITKNKIKNRLKKAADKLKTKKPLTDLDKESQKTKPTRVAGGRKHLNPQEAKKYLYWKY